MYSYIIALIFQLFSVVTPLLLQWEELLSTQGPTSMMKPHTGVTMGISWMEIRSSNAKQLDSGEQPLLVKVNKWNIYSLRDMYLQEIVSETADFPQFLCNSCVQPNGNQIV